jgi:hypothetical protein
MRPHTCTRATIAVALVAHPPHGRLLVGVPIAITLTTRPRPLRRVPHPYLLIGIGVNLLFWPTVVLAPDPRCVYRLLGPWSFILAMICNHRWLKAARRDRQQSSTIAPADGVDLTGGDGGNRQDRCPTLWIFAIGGYQQGIDRFHFQATGVRFEVLGCRAARG